MKAAWVTDIHLNFLDRIEREKFYQTILDSNTDCVFITGDISEARGYKYCGDTEDVLLEMVNYIKKPIYFVLGNHDYYFGDIETVRKNMWAAMAEDDNLIYLTSNHGFALNKKTVIFGADGWADGRAGDYENTHMVLNDGRLIADLNAGRVEGKYGLLEAMQALSDEDTTLLIDDLDFYLNESMKDKPSNIIILTHVPPFADACLYRGKATDDYALPFYCNKNLGDALLKVAHEWPDIKFTVLCGHTHSRAQYQALDNMIVLTGASEYNAPQIAQIIEY